MKQVERSSHTRAALVSSARSLWADRGYAAVGTPEIARAAGVTRGALYHQFADKRDLFAAVAEAVEVDVTQRIADRVAAAGGTDPAGALRTASRAWLDACEEPEVRQVILLDGPVILGWEGMRDLTLRHGLGLTEAMLATVVAGPTRGLAHVLIGALNEAAMYALSGPDERAEAEAVLDDLLAGLLSARTTGRTGSP